MDSAGLLLVPTKYNIYITRCIKTLFLWYVCTHMPALIHNKVVLIISETTHNKLLFVGNI